MIICFNNINISLDPNLTDLNIQNSNFTSMNFQNINISNSDLSNSIMSNVKFNSNTNITGTKIGRAHV